ncbi:hypothetical protein TSUD_326220 [Trifolium subterraneum]|uniref:Uncharacterized protein n=1 Tax=Trifolium subterraneum TaxID=3900 RepID=A0A2Z6M4C0_TRISU|nr:hypothetical protein TSUD_326220 [Trifolium subterraneum]
MEQDRRLQLIDLAIQKHIHDKSDNNSNHHHNLKDYETEYQLVLSQLLAVSELELSKRDEIVNQYKESNPSESVAAVNEEKESETVDDGGSKGSENNDDEIIKEVKKVKKQNFVTHCLLSAMIFLTVAWQLSEVSLVWKVKEGINHPFRSIGNMVKDTVKEVKEKVSDFNGKDDDDNKENNESTSLTTSIKIPDITNMDVPSKGME